MNGAGFTVGLETPEMIDVMFALVTVLFFAVGLAYVAACDRLK